VARGSGVTLKSRLADGDTLLGTFVKTPHPHIVEVLASGGLDLLCLDAEHASFDRRDLDTCIMAARSSGVPVIVRPPSATPEQLLNALDLGADGVLVPHVRSAAEARAVAAAGHYGVGGGLPTRGYAGSSRSAGYGSIGIADHLTNSAARTAIIAQIEDVEALAEIDAIADADGLDALFIGRIDLTVALGSTDPDDARVIAACDHIIAACARAGRPVGIFTSRPADAALWHAKGVRLFLLGSDHGFVRDGARALRAASGL
jgi:staphyloferrin B biosynthesis citrate synthase